MKRTSSSAWSKRWIGWRDGLTRREVAAHPHPRKVRQLDKTASCYHQKQSDFIVSGKEIIVLFFIFGRCSKKTSNLPYRLGHHGTFSRFMCNVHQPRNVSRICFNVLRASVIQWSNIWCAPDMALHCWEKWKRGREALRWLPGLERWTTGPESWNQHQQSFWSTMIM